MSVLLWIRRQFRCLLYTTTCFLKNRLKWRYINIFTMRRYSRISHLLKNEWKLEDLYIICTYIHAYLQWLKKEESRKSHWLLVFLLLLRSWWSVLLCSTFSECSGIAFLPSLIFESVLSKPWRTLSPYWQTSLKA